MVPRQLLCTLLLLAAVAAKSIDFELGAARIANDDYELLADTDDRAVSAEVPHSSLLDGKLQFLHCYSTASDR